MKLLGLDIKRLNRLSYILTVFISMFVFVSVGLLLSLVISIIIGVFYNFNPEYPDYSTPIMLFLLTILWYVYVTYCVVRRFHDINESGWWALTAFIPFVNIPVGLILLFRAGTSGSNKYGKPYNGVYILGLSTNR